MSLYPYKIIRAFAVDGSDDVLELAKTMDLPLAPTRHQWVRLPDGSKHQVLRVVLQAREPATGPHGWSFRLQAAEWIEMELALEPATAMQAAKADGWVAA